MVTFKPTEDLANAAYLTLSNMRPYYEYYSVDWDASQIERMTQELVNWDILLNGKTVGVLRLSFDKQNCDLRDLQIDQQHQNLGIGSQAIIETKRLAKESNANQLRLKVFKNSPAVKLYQRQGFDLSSEDERFYYMVCILTT